MNNGSVWKLSKIYADRNKSIKKSVILLAISFILLFVTIWGGIGFYGIVIAGTATKQDNLIANYEEHTGLLAAPDLKNYLNNFERVESYGIRFGSINPAIGKQTFYLNGAPLTCLKKTTDKYVVDENINKHYYENGQLIGYDTGLQLLLDSDKLSLLTSQPIVYGSGFNDAGKRQLMLSERFLRFYGITAEQAINNRLSFNISYDNLKSFNYKLNGIDEDVDIINFAVFDNFKVVGIFSDALLSENYDCDIIATVASLNFDNLPTVTERIYSYKRDDYEAFSREITDKGEIFPIMLNNTFISPWFDHSYQNTVIDYPPLLAKYQLLNFKDALMVHSLAKEMNVLFALKGEMIRIISYYQFMTKYYTFIAVIGVMMTGVVLFNIYNINTFNSGKKRHSMTICKFMGMTPKDLKKLDFYQNLRFFGKALFFALIFSVILVFILAGILIMGIQSDIKKILLPLIWTAPVAAAILSAAVILFVFLFSVKTKKYYENNLHV